jgi:hypothetical protein
MLMSYSTFEILWLEFRWMEFRGSVKLAFPGVHGLLTILSSLNP